MNELSSISSRLFPLPANFPSTEALDSLQKTRNPEMYLKRVLQLDPHQYFKFLQACLEAKTYDHSWYEKNEPYIASLVKEFTSKSTDSSSLPTPPANQEEFREQLLQKKRAERIQTLYSFIHSPQDKEELIKKKMLDCLESFLKIRALVHDNGDQDNLDILKIFFIDQPEICSFIETQNKPERAQTSAIVTKLGNSKAFEKFTLDCSLTYLEDCFYSLLKLPIRPNLSETEQRLLQPFWSEIIKFETPKEMSLFFEDKPEALVKLAESLMGFFISNETIYVYKETVSCLIDNLKDLAPLYINQHGSKNPDRAATCKMLITFLEARLEAVIAEKESSPSDWEAFTNRATLFTTNLPIYIKGKPDHLEDLCNKIPPLKSLNLIRPPSSELSASEWAELALERTKPHSLLIGVYLSISSISPTSSTPHIEKSISSPPQKWSLEDFINAFQPSEPSETVDFENLEFLKNLLAASTEPKTYKNFLPRGFEEWYPDLSDFPLGDYIDYILFEHATEIENFLRQSQNFKNYQTAMIRQQTTAYRLESQEHDSTVGHLQNQELDSARAFFEDFITETVIGTSHQRPIPPLEKKEKEKEKEREENASESLNTFSEEDQKFYHYLEDAPAILATYIANQATEREPEKALNTLKIVLLYIDDHRTQIESVAELLKKKPSLNRDRLRELLTGSRFLKLLDRLLEE
ncbi:MAG: hypothetical protein CK425_00295 [Parachlamydia sp.]|nr:MAG: hypothetical protein CK425_00295 [Parachlamydia sp.]